jgi:DnaA family protein
MRQLPLPVRLRDHASFASFHEAASPQAVAQLRRLAGGEAGIVWLHGGSGVGKSHLLQAVCNAVPAPARAGFFPLRTLQTMSGGVVEPAALEGWQALDVCCIDDIDFAVGDVGLERALFSLYREVDERRARLVVSAQQPPARLGWTLRDIGSRFAAASVHRLRELDEQAQAEALSRRAALRGLELPEETTRYLQRRFPRDMQTLCSLLDALDEASLVEQRRITVPFIREVLGDAAS